MKGGGCRAPICLTPTLPLIPILQLHNSYVVTDHPQLGSLESQLIKTGGGSYVCKYSYLLIGNVSELLEGLVLSRSWPGLWLQCGAEACLAGWSGFDIFFTVSFTNVSPFFLTRFQSVLVSNPVCIILISDGIQSALKEQGQGVAGTGVRPQGWCFMLD